MTSRVGRIYMKELAASESKGCYCDWEEHLFIDQESELFQEKRDIIMNRVNLLMSEYSAKARRQAADITLSVLLTQLQDDVPTEEKLYDLVDCIVLTCVMFIGHEFLVESGLLWPKIKDS